MKKLILLLLACCSLTIYACASKTIYIEIQQPTKLWMGAKPIYSAKPGDVLRVVKKKTCILGKGTCWWVKNDKEGYAGIVSADEMKSLHRVYKVGGTKDDTRKKQIYP